VTTLANPKRVNLTKAAKRFSAQFSRSDLRKPVFMESSFGNKLTLSENCRACHHGNTDRETDPQQANRLSPSEKSWKNSLGRYHKNRLVIRIAAA
jgi:hypothetical protein